MSRFTFQEPKKETINPIWRGIGFLILVALTVGGFLVTGYLIDLQQQTGFLPFSIPTNFNVPVGRSFSIPGRLIMQLLVTIFLDVVAYGLMVIGYAMLNPPKRDPTDAPWAGRR